LSVLQGTLETFTGIGLMLGPPIGGALFQVIFILPTTSYTLVAIEVVNFWAPYIGLVR